MHYDSIEITDFRGIKHLRLDNLGDINIITGRNNVGKSSCLEAILLAATGNAEFKDAFNNDVLKFVMFRRSIDPSSWEYMLRKGSTKSSILVFEKKKDKTEISGLFIANELDDLEIGPDARGINALKDKRDLFLEHLSRRYGDSLKTLPRIKKRLYFYFKDEVETFAEMFELENGIKDVVSTRRFGKTKKSRDDVLFVKGFDNLEKQLHDVAATKGTLHESIERLREKISELNDIRPIDERLHVFYKNGDHMPLFTMGDGWKAAILSTLAAHVISDGILIMEEPENYLHPGLMIHVIDELVLACMQHKIQIFLSTHSEEFLRFFIERATELDLSVIKVSKLDDVVEAEVMTRSQAQENMDELSIDLRGF